jgi:hypothetical protein
MRPWTVALAVLLALLVVAHGAVAAPATVTLTVEGMT